VRVVHEPVGDDGERGVRVDTEETLAATVEFAEGFLSKARGLMFRRSIPDDYALVFPFDDVAPRDTHMVFVPFDIDAVWTVDEEVAAVKRLRAWRGVGYERADTLIELPAGAAANVEPGDRVRVVEDTE
jgi:uncharacterized membrane protein (UPF0127 family)